MSPSSDDEVPLSLFPVLVELKWDLFVEMSKGSSAPHVSSF